MISLVFLGITLGISFIILRQEKVASQPGLTFLSIRQALVHRYEQAMGIGEIGAFITTLLMTILLQGQWTLFFLSAAAWVCVGAMISIWTLRIYPINKRVELWEADFIPEDWPKVRSANSRPGQAIGWHRFQVERAALAIVGFVAVIITASVS